MTREILCSLAVAHGFREPENIIHVFAGGSHQHGARIAEKADLDICGIYIPDAPQVIGLDRAEHFVGGTGDDHTRNTPDDVDIVLYSLRKWAHLTAKGNPTVLSYLFMPAFAYGVWREIIVPSTALFVASSHANAFCGFANAQIQRINGERGTGKHGQRDPLIEEFGWDCKAGMHVIRMMLECRELLLTGRMTFPNPEVQTLLAIRRGEWSRDRVTREHLLMEEEIRDLQNGSTLPKVVDRGAISSLISYAHLRHWGMS